MAGWFEIGAAAVGGGTVSAVVAPFVTWRVDQHRERFAARARIISELRAAVKGVRRREASLGWLLDGTAVAALKRHMRQEKLEALARMQEDLENDVPDDTYRGAVCNLLADEADFLEARWKLS